MAYQRLNVSRAWPIAATANADIPDISLEGPSGTNTGVGASQLIDNTKDFTALGVLPKMIVVNTTNADPDNWTYATIDSVGTDTLELNANIFLAGAQTYEIYGGNQQGALLYVGVTSGVNYVEVLTVGGDTVQFANPAQGEILPVLIKRVTASANITKMVALW